MDSVELRRLFEGIEPADASLYAEGFSEAIEGRGAASDPLRADLVRELAEEAERLGREPIPELTKELYDLYELTGNRIVYEGVYFKRRRHLTTFGLLAMMFPERADYARSLEAIVEAVLQEKTWCLPAHMRGESMERGIDLFAAETGFALAELLTLAGAALSEPLRERMRAEVDLRLFTPYLTMGPYYWETADQNWAAVCAGSIGSAALLLERDGERLAEMTRKAMSSMKCYLSGFGDDGACAEGVGYWNYGFGYYVYYADLLYRRTKGGIDLLAGDKVEQIALFQQRSYLFGDRTVCFSDTAQQARAMRGLSTYLAARYASVEKAPQAIFASLKDDHCSRFAHALRDVLWSRSHFQGEARAEWGVGSWYFSDVEWLVSRHASTQGRFGFAAKGGHNAEPHNHLDLGQYILAAEGEPTFTADLGRGEYTADYFGEGRYLFACNGAHGHSLPVVGGKSQLAGKQYRALVLEAGASEETDVLGLELAGAYEAPELASLIRRFAFNKGELPELEVRDDFSLREPVEWIEELVISRCEPVEVGPGVICLGGERLDVRLTYDALLLAPTIERHTFSGHDGSEEVYYRIVLRASVLGEHRVSVTLRFAFERRET